MNLNQSWVEDAFLHTDPMSLINPPPSTTGVDMTWVVWPKTLYICAACVVFSCITSAHAVWAHINNYDYPRLQIHIVRILLMIPFYGVLSLGALMLPSLRFGLDTIRDTYESFVLYTFFVLLVQYCGGEAQLVRSLQMKRYKGVHPFPLGWIPYYRLNGKFYLRCKRYVLQYAVIKPCITLIACVTSPFGWYEEAVFGPYELYTYCMAIANTSISYSLYYLVLFHLETEKELHYCKPAWKFICIKSIIFFAFWQSIAVAMLIAFGWIYTGEGEKREEVNSAIQDVLMCIELVPVSLLHHLAFGRKKLEDEMNEEPQHNLDEGGIYASKANQPSAKTNLDQALSLEDFVKDTIQTIFYQKDKLTGADEDGDQDAEEADYSGGGEDAAVGSKVGLTDDDLKFLAMMHEREDLEAQNRAINELGPEGENAPYMPDVKEEDVWLNPKGIVRNKDGTEEMVGINPADLANESRPAAFCAVCGRYDRRLVQRKSGLKCVECVGKGSKAVLREQQREAHAGDNDGSCVVCGRKDRVMVKKGQKMTCVQCLFSRHR